MKMREAMMIESAEVHALRVLFKQATKQIATLSHHVRQYGGEIIPVDCVMGRCKCAEEAGRELIARSVFDDAVGDRIYADKSQ